MNITEKLFENQDLKYKEFQSKLMPTIDEDTIIGVRTPMVRKLAKEFSKFPEAKNFMQNLPHRYYEENNIHAFMIETIKDYDECIRELDRFLPYVNNWATCDSMSPKILRKHTDELYEQIKIWINSDLTYTVRFAIEMLMSFYLDEKFKPEYSELVAQVESDEYYVKMMQAWYFATALAKQYDDTIHFVEKRTLPEWVHKKTIQKAIESYRITDEQKSYLRTLK